jgi:hypothetical protein
LKGYIISVIIITGTTPMTVTATDTGISARGGAIGTDPNTPIGAE